MQKGGIAIILPMCADSSNSIWPQRQYSSKRLYEELVFGT